MSDLVTLDTVTQIHLGTCLVMTGVIWVMQLVHYPSFAKIAEEKFKDFVSFHGNRISIIVMPLMILELASGMSLAILSGWRALWLLNLIGIAIIWASTFMLSVPCHKQLSEAMDRKTIDKLVVTNWPRTLLWSLRSAVLLFNS